MICPTTSKGQKMDILKNMEALFIVALVIGYVVFVAAQLGI